jgi:hypothetical protein
VPGRGRDNVKTALIIMACLIQSKRNLNEDDALQSRSCTDGNRDWERHREECVKNEEIAYRDMIKGIFK